MTQLFKQVIFRGVDFPLSHSINSRLSYGKFSFTDKRSYFVFSRTGIFLDLGCVSVYIRVITFISHSNKIVYHSVLKLNDKNKQLMY